MDIGRRSDRVPVYEDRLERDGRWALDEGGRHFEDDESSFRSAAQDRSAAG